MASSFLKGLVTDYGKLGYQLWHRPLKMASLVYEREIGGAVASTPDRTAWVRALAGDSVLCSWARHFTLTVPLLQWPGPGCSKPDKTNAVLARILI